MSTDILRILKVTNDIQRECVGVARRAGADDDYIKHTIKPLVNDKDGILFVKKHEGYITGFIIGYSAVAPEYTNFLPGQKVSKIDWLCVDKTYHECGIGTELMLTYIGSARSAGFKGLFLTADPKRPGLVLYYKRFGFETIGWNRLMGKIL